MHVALGTIGGLQKDDATTNVIDLNNGDYNITITTTRAATYRLRVFVEGAQLGSDRTITFRPGAVDGLGGEGAVSCFC